MLRSVRDFFVLVSSLAFYLFRSLSPQAVQYFSFSFFFFFFTFLEMMKEVELQIRLVPIRLVLLLLLFYCCCSFCYYFCCWFFCSSIVVAFVVAPVDCSIVLFSIPVTWIHPSSGFGGSLGFGAKLVVRLLVFSWLLLKLLLLVWLLFYDFCVQVPVR